MACVFASIAHVIVRPVSLLGREADAALLRAADAKAGSTCCGHDSNGKPVEFDSEPERPGSGPGPASSSESVVGPLTTRTNRENSTRPTPEPASGPTPKRDIGPASEETDELSGSGPRSDDADSVPGELRLGPAPARMAQTDSSVREQSPLVRGVNRSPSKTSERAKSEAQPSLFPEKAPGNLCLPATWASRHPDKHRPAEPQQRSPRENARMLENVLDDYGIKGDIISVRPGPVVTLYELEPAPGLKASRIIGLADDIARSMSALSARVSTIPGRSVIASSCPTSTARRCS